MKISLIFHGIGLLILLLQYVVGFSFDSLQLASKALESPDSVIEVIDGDLSLLSGDRSYYTLVFLTSSDPRHGCQICTDFEPLIRRVARNWFNEYGDTNMLYFINIDLVNKGNNRIFNYLRLNTVPHIWLLPPGKSLDEEHDFQVLNSSKFHFKIPITSKDEQTLELARFISETLQKRIVLQDEAPLYSFAQTFIPTFLLIIFLKKQGGAALMRSVKKYVFMLLSIVISMIYVCGYQFSVMEHVPFVAKDYKNNIIFISGGTHYQLGLETLIVCCNYLALGILLLTLIYFGKYKVSNTSLIRSEFLKFVIINLSAFSFYLLSSSLTSIFLRKDPDYPFPYSKLF